MSISYRPDIDGLRAVAVASVIGLHAFLDCISGDFIGVDIFLVISGFLILVLILIACLWMGWHVQRADEYKPLGKHVAAGAAFSANFSFWFEAGYFDKASELKVVLAREMNMTDRGLRICKTV